MSHLRSDFRHSLVSSERHDIYDSLLTHTFSLVDIE
jgi:hypothetical protein